MQIHEITEGFFSNVARGFAQGVTGVDVLEPSSVDTATVKQAQAAQQAQTTQPSQPVQAQPTTQTRIVVSLSQPGQDQPSKYYKVGDTWTNELGQQITGSTQTAYLDKLIPTHGTQERVPVMPAEPTRAARRRLRSK